MPKYGFTFDWMYHQSPKTPKPAEPDFKALDFLVKHGFNCVRLPLSYWFWTDNSDYSHPQELGFRPIDRYVEACRERGLHLSLGLYRAPGHCRHAISREKHNLWVDAAAQGGLLTIWNFMAERYVGVPSEFLSFELLCEPSAIGERELVPGVYEELMRRMVNSIRNIDPQREILVTGLDNGNEALPSLEDLPVIQSCHGYQPMALTHHHCAWWRGVNEHFVEQSYPDLKFEEITWNRHSLARHYAPWRELEINGTPVHVGDFGCYSQTDNELAMAWFADLLKLFRGFGWGWCMGGFTGDYGLIGHGRQSSDWERIDGFLVDRGLLDLLKENRLESTPAPCGQR